MNDSVNEYIRAWIGKADNDLKNAELVLAAQDENCPYGTVCFHCQHRWFPADGAIRESRYDELLPLLVDVQTIQGVCCRTDG